jgi:sigma-B regulation protein RsbU (phosphoserine phosphatase)
VAGDFYDFIVADDNRAGLLIADVSGHGVPAALIASMVKLAATSQRANAADPARLLAGMNAALCGTLIRFRGRCDTPRQGIRQCFCCGAGR